MTEPTDRQPRTMLPRTRWIVVAIVAAALVAGLSWRSHNRRKVRTPVFAELLVVGAPASDGEVLTLAGQSEPLSKQWGAGPTVMLFGNFSCPGFRGFLEGFRSLRDRQAAHATFLTVYIRESHPAEQTGPEAALNKSEGICYRQARSDAERLENANDFVQRTKWDIPTFVAPVDDEIASDYLHVGAPMRLVIVEGGVIRFRSPEGTLELMQADEWLTKRSTPGGTTKP